MEHRPPPPRTRAAAVLLPLVAMALLMPPFISLFAAPAKVFGIPLVVVYMFGVWLALVVLTAWLARRLGAQGDAPPHA